MDKKDQSTKIYLTGAADGSAVKQSVTGTKTGLSDIIMEDPINWLEYSIEMRMEELLKYHKEKKIKGYSYQTILL